MSDMKAKVFLENTGIALGAVGAFCAGVAVPAISAGAIFTAGKALGGNFHVVSHAYQQAAPAFDMALNLEHLQAASTYLAVTTPLIGLALATTTQDLKDIGNKLKHFGAGLLDFSSKTGKEMGVLKDGQTASAALQEYTDRNSSFLSRATCRIMQVAGVNAAALGTLGLIGQMLNNHPLETTPGLSTLAIGAAAAVGVGGALYLLGREGLKTDQSKDAISLHLNPVKEPAVDAKKEHSYRVLGPGE